MRKFYKVLILLFVIVSFFSCKNKDEDNYLIFTAVESTYIYFEIEKDDFLIDNFGYDSEFENPISLQYRLKNDKKFKDYTWNNSNKSKVMKYGDRGDEILLSKGEKIYFKGNNETLSSRSVFLIFKSTKLVEASGNIMALMKNKTTVSSYSFYKFFDSCDRLLTSPKLPATELAPNCYDSMFEGCTSLKKAPELPATTLAYSCYFSMFEGCRFLIEAPELPATELASGCYNSMFKGCRFLRKAPELPATELFDSCYKSMFEGCTSLTRAPKLPATKLEYGCYQSMFSDCTSLVEAPELPATTLIWDCYNGMFEGCTSLTEAPELPAETLARNCYSNMFNGCSSLNSVTCLAIHIGYHSYDYFIFPDHTSSWLSGVPFEGTFKCKVGVNWRKGDSGIPEGWTVEYV